MRGPSEGLHEGPALGRGGRGKGATPQPMAGPRGRDRHAAPPPGRQETRGPPPIPPPLALRPESGRGGGPPPPSPAPHRRGPPPPRSRGDSPPPPEGTATRWGEQRLDLLPRAHTSVPEQRALQNSMEAACHMTLP